MMPPCVFLGCLLTLSASAARAQRPAAAEDFLGLTKCDNGVAVSLIRKDVDDSILLAEVEAHEAVHRLQATRFPSCEAFVASLSTARSVIDAEIPAYCAQWRIAVGHGALADTTRREYAWRIAAQSGAMENRLQIAQRLAEECPLDTVQAAPSR
jgi:hypothetical protein